MIANKRAGNSSVEWAVDYELVRASTGATNGTLFPWQSWNPFASITASETWEVYYQYALNGVQEEDVDPSSVRASHATFTSLT